MRNFIFYNFKLFRLTMMNETARINWLYDEFHTANTEPPNEDKRLRLLHCVDLPIALREGGTEMYLKKLDSFQQQAFDAYNEMRIKMGR